MHEILKAASVTKAADLDEAELALINRQTLRSLTADEVFTFRLRACGDQVDRDFERFTARSLAQMAALYPGKPVLTDHRWSAGSQTARVYAASVEATETGEQLVLRCYMPRTEGTRELVSALESGVLRECSVGLSVGRALCSICGRDQCETICRHQPGRTYEGKQCWVDLDGVSDVYEVSLVAVPAQPEAGTMKSKRYAGANQPDGSAPERKDAIQLARARLEIETKRYGGTEHELEAEAV